MFISRYLSRSRILLLAVITCLFIMPFTSQGVGVFSWFQKKKDVFLSPEVKGIITLNGQPVANQEVIRSLMYLDEIDRRDTATTDQNGHFYFPQKIIKSSIPNRLIVEHRISQEIFIEKENGEQIWLWEANASSIEEIPEYSKKLAFLNCELSNDLVQFEFKNSINGHANRIAVSICRWQENYIPKYIIVDNELKYKIHDGDFNKLTERFTGKEVKR